MSERNQSENQTNSSNCELKATVSISRHTERRNFGPLNTVITERELCLDCGKCKKHARLPIKTPLLTEGYKNAQELVRNEAYEPASAAFELRARFILNECGEYKKQILES